MTNLSVEFTVGQRVMASGRKGIVESKSDNTIVVLFNATEGRKSFKLKFTLDGKIEKWHSEPTLFSDPSITEGEFLQLWIRTAKQLRININYSDQNSKDGIWEMKEAVGTQKEQKSLTKKVLI